MTQPTTPKKTPPHRPGSVPAPPWVLVVDVEKKTSTLSLVTNAEEQLGPKDDLLIGQCTACHGHHFIAMHGEPTEKFITTWLKKTLDWSGSPCCDGPLRWRWKLHVREPSEDDKAALEKAAAEDKAKWGGEWKHFLIRDGGLDEETASLWKRSARRLRIGVRKRRKSEHADEEE